jgi:hypothetical protein
MAGLYYEQIDRYTGGNENGVGGGGGVTRHTPTRSAQHFQNQVSCGRDPAGSIDLPLPCVFAT